MNKLLLTAGAAVFISVGAMASAQALPTVSKSATIDTQNVHQATFWRWRYWDDDWRWRHRYRHRHHYWRRWHNW